MSAPALGVALALCLCLCPPPAGAQEPAPHGRSVQALRYIGEQRIAHGHVFADTTVGGLSGIDYDPRTDTWVVASDDRSRFGPARFYAVRLDYDERAFRSVSLLGMTPFLREDGAPYPGRWWSGAPPDVEAVRVDPADGTIWYAGEGDRWRGAHPFVRQASPAGVTMRELPLPDMFRMRLGRNAGPYHNRAFEGLAFSGDGQSVWVTMEAPLMQDGEPPSPAAGAMVRFTQFDRDGAVLRQVAYPVGPIPAEPGPGKFADNGVTEILAVDDARLLVIERAAVQDADGKYANHVRLYEADLAEASDVSGLASLAGADFRPAARRLVLDLGTLGLARVDNIEGMAWGPRLAGGRDSLVLVSDDNFNPGQVTQFLAFEVQGSSLGFQATSQR